MKKYILFISLLIISSTSLALVDMSTKQYSQAWEDVKDLGNTREYKKDSNGVFGKNWCSPFDIKNQCSKINLNSNWKKIIKDSKIVKIESLKNKQSFSLKYTSQGFLKEILSNGKVLAFFEYKNTQLSRVQNEWGSVYIYNYNEKSLLTKTIYPDKTSVEVSYNSSGEVISFKDRESCEEKYTYSGDNLLNKTKAHSISETVKFCESKVIVKKTYETWQEFGRVSKKKYISRIKVSSSEDFSDMTYNEFGQPLSITNKKDSPVFYEYYKNRLVKSKKTKDSELIFSYNNIGLLDNLSAYDVNTGKKYTLSFSYNKKRQVIKAVGSDKREVIVNYDKDLIRSIVDKENRVILIAYDLRLKKPISIKLKGEGLIMLTYYSDGSIKEIESPQGEKTVGKVKLVFDSLVSMISPAVTEQYLY